MNQYNIVTNGLWKEDKIDSNPFLSEQIEAAFEEFEVRTEYERNREMVIWTGPEGHRIFQEALQDELTRQILNISNTPIEVFIDPLPEIDSETLSIIGGHGTQISPFIFGIAGESQLNQQTPTIELPNIQYITRQLTEEEQTIQLLDQISRDDI